MLKVVTALYMLVLFVSSVPVFAEKHIIDQGTVRQNGGFPYQINESGSYKLTSDLKVPAGTDGIVISAPHVTLDLNGFSIGGPVVCTSFPTTCPTGGKGIGIRSGDETTIGALDVKIYNGSVHGMGSHGILVSGDGAVIDKVSTDGNAGAGIIASGSVIQSSATGNGSIGILALIVRDTMASSNVGDGIILDGRGGVAIGVFTTLNGGRGILAQNGTVSSSTSTLNTGFGIAATCPSVIDDNTVVANTAGSISPNSTTCVLVNNATRP